VKRHPSNKSNRRRREPRLVKNVQEAVGEWLDTDTLGPLDGFIFAWPKFLKTKNCYSIQEPPHEE
jgi:hypothetical protein